MILRCFTNWNRQMAKLEVITGPMFSGKSEEMIRRLRVAAFAERNLILIRPNLDKRPERNVFGLVETDPKLRGYSKLISRVVLSANDLNEIVSLHKPNVIGIDEVQFFPHDFLDLIINLLDQKKDDDFKIIASGLNLDAEGCPFGIMPELMARADEITILKAICTKCKSEGAIFTQKTARSIKQGEIGGDNICAVRCRKCFVRQSEIPLTN